MRFSDILTNLGHAVPYWPRLGCVLGGPNHAIFVQQLVYWRSLPGSGGDEWISKSRVEITFATGLSIKQIDKVRRDLKQLGLITDRYERRDHRLSFQLSLKRLDELWEDAQSDEHVPKGHMPKRRMAHTQRARATCPKGTCSNTNKDVEEIKKTTIGGEMFLPADGKQPVASEPLDDIPEPTLQDAEMLHANLRCARLQVEDLLTYLRELRTTRRKPDYREVALKCMQRALKYNADEPIPYAIRIEFNARKRSASSAGEARAPPNGRDGRRQKIAEVLERHRHESATGNDNGRAH
jgi:hypothetical protein